MELNELCELIVDCEHKTAPTQDTGYPSIRTPNIGKGVFILDGVNRVSEETYRQWTRRAVPQPGDLVMAREAPVGNVAMIPPGFTPCLGQRTLLIRPDRKKVEPAYLNYFLNGPYVQSLVQAKTNGATVPHLNMKDVRTLLLPELPPRPTQRRIAGILSAYDDLIENSQRRIKILESMARALYREWFVHFRFPGHETHPRVASPLGDIPERWEVKKLGELISIDKGVSYNGAGLTENGNPMVNLKNILAGGGFRRDATKPYSGDFKHRHTVKPGDIILANTDLTQAGNVVASAAMVPRFADTRPILISHHLFAVRLPAELPAVFIYHLLLEDAFRGFAKGYAIGTTVLGLPKEGVLNFAFVMPPENLIGEFVRQVAPLHQLVEATVERVENLRRTRDLLLPRLLSGQIALDELEAA
jgi:type I restriction enzyme S subunit